MASLAQAVKNRLPGLLSKANAITQRFGLNLTPNHFYSDIPDFRHLRKTLHWRKPYSMHGILGAEIGPQLDYARSCCEPYQAQLAASDIYQRAVQRNGVPGFGPIEADFLYAYIRSERPPRIVQIGCGAATHVMLMAGDDEPDYNPKIICVEPYPNDSLKRAAEQGRITLHGDMAQDMDRSILTDVGNNGLLFIDSSHSLRVGGEVIQLICEVLPRLSPGVKVHLHDIPFPYDFGPTILKDAIFTYREHALLYAFLLNNPGIRIDVSLSMIHHAEPNAVKAFIPGYKPCKTRDGLLIENGHHPTSIYLRTGE